MDGNFVDILVEWLKNWRSANNVPDGELLSGELLERFVGELQSKILSETGGFGPAVKGFENAKLVLYSGVDWKAVGEFCEQSGGKYYMISQTKASFLWRDDFRQAVAESIGEKDPKKSISARVLEGKSYKSKNEWTRVGRYATDSDRFLALDDFLSSELARGGGGASRGDVTYFLSPDARPETVGLSSEVPEVFTQKYVKGSGGLSDFTVAYDLTKNADGSFSFKTADVSDAFVYFDKSGRVGFVDLTPSVGGESGVAADGSLKIGGLDVKGKVSFSDVKAAFRDSVMFFDEFGVFKGQDFKGTKLEGLVESRVPSEFAYSMSGENYALKGARLSSGQVRSALKDSSVFLDEAGGVISRGFEGTVLDGVAESAVPGEYAHCVSGEVYERMPSEAQVSAKYGEAFDSLSARGRLRARELEGISGVASEVPKSGQAGFEQLESLRESYAKSAGKSAAELSEFENAFLNTAARRQAAAEAVSKAGGSSVFKAGSRASSWSSCKNWFKSAEGAKFLKAAGKGAGAGLGVVAAYFSVMEMLDAFESAKTDWQLGNRFSAVSSFAGRAFEIGTAFFYAKALMELLGSLGSSFGPVGAGVGAAAGLILGAWMGEYAGNEVQRMLAGIGESFDRLFGTYTPRPLDLKGGDGKDFLVGGKAADRIDGMSGDDILCGDAGDDLIYGGDGDDSLYGDDGNDTLVGDLGDDRLYGGRGNDLLDGRHGNDVLTGGAGSDMLMGGAGDDVYVFELGGGQDQIADISGNDAIVFEKGVDPERVVMERLGSDLLIQYSDNDCVLVKNAYGFADGSRFVERIIFKEGADKKNLIIPDDEQTGSYKILFVGAVWNLDDIVQRAKIRRGTDRNDNMIAYSSSKYYSGNEEFYAGAGDDKVYAGDGDDIVFGGDGNDSLCGDAGDDRLSGGDGNDSLSGDNGNDVLIGGSGDDRLSGGSGDDSYVFNLGDGCDVVSEWYSSDVLNNDRIVFGEGISPESLLFRRVNNDLVIRYGSAGDSVRIRDAYSWSDGRCFVENIVFADGTVWGLDEVKRRASVVYSDSDSSGSDRWTGYGSSAVFDGNETFYGGAGDDKVYAGDGDDIVFGGDGNDSLCGDAGDDRLSGGDGNDSLSGDNGNDVLIGGSGDDRLSGGSGDDSYVFNLGDGCDVVSEWYSSDVLNNDRIVFGEGISPESLLFRRVNNDLVIRYGSAGDSVRIRDAYSWSDGRCFVENIVFADGTVWGLDEVKRRASVVYSDSDSSGSDRWTGYGSSAVFDGNETFYGGAGDDKVYAGDGDDIVFGGDGNDSLCGDAGDDRLSGGDGNDSLSGDNGNDVLIGGSGDDRLSGGSGDDSYVFNLGDGCDVVSEWYSSDVLNNDRIVFGEGISPESLLFRRVNNDLVIRYGSAGDSVRIRDAYSWSDGRCFVENIVFADGTKYEIDYENLCLKAAAVKQTGVAGADEIKPAAAGCAACFDAAGFIAGVEEYAAAKNLPWVSGSAGYRGKTAADSGLSDSGQDYSVLSESSGCGSAVYDSGSAVEAGINNFTDLIIQDMCELAAGSACASASAAAAPAAQSAPAQLWAC